MIRLLIVGRRAAGITRAGAHRHLRDAHGPLVLCQPADAGAPLAYYAQNHIGDGIYFAGTGAHAIERDLVTELCFDDLAAMRAGMASAYHAEVLGPDEKRFVDEATVAKMMVDTRAVTSGPRSDHKLFALISRAPLADEDRWRSATAALAERIESLVDLTRLDEHRVLPPPGGTPFVDRVYEAWFATRDSTVAAISALARMIGTADAVDRERSLLLVGEGFTQERLRALYTTC